ncbi:MAG: SPFH/Band 7/PHB domain protein [Cryobacterium sp.]|nr:SPFH/Band 7/PHB domain protein [Oligoflexia bacterium]
MNAFEFNIGFFGTIAAFVLVGYILYRISVIVLPFQTTLILRFGKCVERIEAPGIYFRPSLFIPGIRRLDVSRKYDYVRMSDLHVNDRDGTTLRVDLWLEFRVVNAETSVFGIESWREALGNRVLHSLMNTAGSKRLESILSERSLISREILDEVREEAKGWGVSIEQLWIQDVRLLPEISKQFFDRVAAQIELRKARLEEEGRIRVQLLQADTERKVADLQGRAKSMQPLAVGRAYQRLGGQPKVLKAFEKLYQLSLLQPGKVVTFLGFGGSEMRATDALMIPDSETPETVSRPSGNHHAHS